MDVYIYIYVCKGKVDHGVCVCGHMYIYIYIHIHINRKVCLHLQTYTLAMLMYIYIYIYVCIYIYIYITYIYIYTYVIVHGFDSTPEALLVFSVILSRPSFHFEWGAEFDKQQLVSTGAVNAKGEMGKLIAQWTFEKPMFPDGLQNCLICLIWGMGQN